MYPTKTITNKRTIPLSLPGKEPLPTVSLDPFSTLSTTTTNSNSTYATASFLSSSSAQQEIILSSFEKIQNCVVNYLYQLKRLPYIRFSTAIQECLNNLETMNRTIANHTISLQSYYRRNDPLTMTTVMTDDIVHISDQLYRQYIKYIADLITAQQIYAQHTIHILDILSPSSLSLPGNENFDPYEFHDGGHPELFQFYESLRSECDPNLVSILQDLVKLFIRSFEKILREKENFLQVVASTNMEQLKARSIYMFYQLVQDFRNLYVKDILDPNCAWISCDTSFLRCPPSHGTQSKISTDTSNLNSLPHQSTKIIGNTSNRNHNLSRINLQGNLYASSRNFYATLSIENSEMVKGTVLFTTVASKIAKNYAYFPINTVMDGMSSPDQLMIPSYGSVTVPDAYVLLPLPSSFTLIPLLKNTSIMDNIITTTSDTHDTSSSIRSPLNGNYSSHRTHATGIPNNSSLHKINDYASYLSQFSVVVRLEE